MTSIKTNKKGLTLVEILLYFTLIGVVISASFSLATTVLNSSKKSDNINKVQTDTFLSMDLISRTVQQADSINMGNSTFNDDAGQISLEMNTVALDPTIFTITDGSITIKEGANAVQQITSSEVNCTQLRFERVTADKAPDQIIIDLSCEQLNNEPGERSASSAFHTTVSLRRT